MPLSAYLPINPADAVPGSQVNKMHRPSASFQSCKASKMLAMQALHLSENAYCPTRSYPCQDHTHSQPASQLKEDQRTHISPNQILRNPSQQHKSREERSGKKAEELQPNSIKTRRQTSRSPCTCPVYPSKDI